MPAPGQPEDASFPGEFVPSESGKDCDKFAGGWGVPMTDFEYIWYANADEKKYPSDACRPYYHKAAQIDNFKVNVLLNGPGDINITGTVTAPTFYGTFVGSLNGTASGNKSFDIPHVTQKGKRIRHIIAEGPEPGIYVRGRIKDTNVIELPEYWNGLIDPESITVTLTQIGHSQDLIVDKIESDKRIFIRSGVGADINCCYEVWAARWLNPMNHDEKLIVVYDGETPDDYPGDNKQFLIGGWDYDRRNPQWESLDKQP